MFIVSLRLDPVVNNCPVADARGVFVCGGGAIVSLFASG